MADIKPKAEEDKEGDTISDRPWRRLSSPSPTAQSRAPTGLSSDPEYRPFNGPQPEPVSPSGGISNRPPSHSNQEGLPHPQEESDGDSTNGSGPKTTEDVAPRVTPKISTRPKLDNISSAKDRATGESPFAKNKPSPYIKSEEASASDVASDSDNSDFGVPRPEEPHKRSLIDSAGQNRTGRGSTDGRSLWDFGSESSESSSDDCEEDLTWEPQSEFMHLLWTSPKRTESSSSSISQSRRKRKLNTVDRAGDVGFVPSAKQPPTCDGSDDNDSLDSKERNARRKPVAKSPMAPQLDCSDEAVDTKEHFIKSKLTHEGNDAESAKLNHANAESESVPVPVSESEGEPLFFPCTKCNVNFKEKAHLHRHMLHHQAPPNANAPRPYICRECGRSFRDGNALQKHMVIHQARRERLMEEIKGLSELQDEGRQARLQCPQCVFGTDCAKTFVQHAKTHEKDKRYYCCDSCNHMATTPQELEAHRCTAHNVNHVHTGVAHAKRAEGREDSETGTNRITLLYCSICPFSTQNRNILKKHTELIHRQPYFEKNEKEAGQEKKEEEEEEDDEAKPVSRFAEPKKPGLDLCRLTNQAKPGHSRLSQLRPKLNSETQALRKGDASPFWSDGIADLCVRNRVVQQKDRKGLSLPLFKWGFGSSTNKLSSALPRLDKPSKLSPSPTARIDVTTGHLHDEEGNQECAALKPGDGEKTKHISDSDVCSNAKMDKSAEDICQNHKTDRESDNSVIPSSKELPSQPVPHRTVSKRKMSIPYHNTLKPKPEPISPVLTEEDDDDEDDDDDGDEYDDEDDDDEDDSFDLRDYSSTFLNRSTTEAKLNSFVSPKPLYLPRPCLPVRKDILHSNGSEDEEESDCDDIQDLVIKEECEETAVSLDDVPSTQSMHGPFSDLQGSPSFSSDRKTCPYCPAVFESGVGLSNHVRGHLHRVGLTYDARHMVSPEQVASQDRQPRIRRKAPSTITRRLKKAVDKPETQTEHTCPLCWGWFDTRTGLSNHVRGHLKRIGRGLGSGGPGSSRSPLCILNDLLRDETEHRSLLALLGRRPSHSRPFVSQKFAGSDGLFLTPTGVPVKVQHSRARVGATAGARAAGSGGGGEPKSRLWSGEEAVDCKKKEKKVVVEEEEIRAEDHRVVDRAPSSTLVELLRRRKQERELEIRDRQAHAARRQLPISPARESVGRLAALKPDPGWSQGKADVKKVCIHCNTTFHSAVSLSNHLRAYARRKRAAQLDGTTYDCKQKKPRSRPGPKKKMFSLPHMPEEIYRLTCRFCDLVFQGPLSVQEDWIKHLQRHLMHTSVPHTGAAMVEVTAVCKELPPPPPPERLVLPRQHTPLQVLPTVS